MGYLVVSKSKLPKKMQKIQYEHESGKKYSLNLLFYRDDIKKIENRGEEIIDGNEAEIYFPINGVFYGKKVEHKGGFTLRDITKAIHLIAKKLIKRDMNDHRDKYDDADLVEEIMAQYGIMLLWQDGNRIFAEVHRGPMKKEK